MTSPTTTVTGLARRFAVDIDLNPGGAANWQPLVAIEEFKPAFAPRRVADESFDDAGAGRMAVTGSQWTIDAKIIHRAGPDGVTFNAVQEYLRTQSEATNAMAGEVHIRWYDRSGVGEAWDGRCLVDWTPDGGNGGARDVVSIKFNGQGAKAAITNPNASALPVVSLLTPTGGGIAGGNLVQVRGRKFTGATSVTFGGTAGTPFTVADDTLIVVTAPAKAAGQYDVVVTTPGGVSATSAASKYTYV
jgi:hypothetical protein